MSEKVTDILSKTQPEVVADRQEAIELARQVQAGEVEVKPFNAAAHLTDIESVMRFVHDIELDDEPEIVLHMLQTATAAARRIVAELPQPRTYCVTLFKVDQPNMNEEKEVEIDAMDLQDMLDALNRHHPGYQSQRWHIKQPAQ